MTHRTLRAAIASAFLGAAALSAQAQPAPTTTLRGRVVADDTGDPLANVRVVAASGALGDPVVLTDDEGRFTITVRAGTSRLIAHKTGYGPRDVEIRGTTSAIDIRLQRGAAISGRVVNASGDPVQGARVAVSRGATKANEPSVAAVTTDDRGEYRLGSLAAGDYVLAASTMAGIRSVSVGGIEMRPDVQTTYYPVTQTTYYPDTTVRAEAEAIALEPGDDRADMEFVVSGAQSVGLLTQIAMGPLSNPPVTPPGATATGIVRGRVVSSDGRSLPRAQVLLSMPNDLRHSVVSQADGDGDFEFRDLPAGSYRLVASKTGYGPVASSDSSRDAATVFGMASVPVTLREGETRERVDISLLRWGTLSGRILDERGDPVQGARVQVLRMRYEAGRRQLAPTAAAALSDDLGRYRLYNLPPAAYIVSASVSDTQSADLPGYARSYYPGTLEAREAQTVSIALAQDVVGIDMLLSRTATARISGQLVNAAGEHTLGGSLMLTTSRRSTDVTNVPMGARVQRDGQFEFPNVPPGQYLIQSYRGRPNGWTEGEFGTLAVSIDGADVTHLVLQTSLGSQIHGRVTFDTADPSSRPRPSAIQIAPIPVDFDLAPPSTASADIHDDWTFDIVGISGPRRMQLVRAPAGWTLEDVVVNGISAIDRPLSFGRSEQSLRDVEVLLTDRVSELTGTVTDDDHQPVAGSIVMVFPTDRERWYPGSRYFRTAASRADGAFALAGLPFGTYYAAVIARPLAEGDDAWQDASFLSAMISRASTITIREDEKQTLDLRLSAR